MRLFWWIIGTIGTVFHGTFFLFCIFEGMWKVSFPFGLFLACCVFTLWKYRLKGTS